MASAKNMTFHRYGRSFHMLIETASDLQQVLQLDQAHWVATNAPLSTINCDRTFLSLIDTDHNGRITCQEVKEAIEWLLAVLSDHQGITAGHCALATADLDSNHPQAQHIRQAILKMLSRFGQGPDEKITLEQVRQIRAEEESKPLSEAGLVLPAAAQDPEISRFIADAVATVGGIDHPSGNLGINQVKLDEFVRQIQDFLKWHQQGQIPPDQSQTPIMPLGPDTPNKYASLACLRNKIDQYFAQCTVLALGENFSEQIGWTPSEREGLDLDDPVVIEKVLREAPLARPNSDQVLCFTEKINPYYAQMIKQLRREVLTVVLPESTTTINAGQWQRVKDFFTVHQAWLQAKPSTALESLGVQRLQGYLDLKFTKAVQALITESSHAALTLDNIRLTEKVLLCQAYMLSLVNNFVSFPHLYDTKSRAMFERGTLIMDGRRFNLAVDSANYSKHAQVAKTSNMFVLYVEVAAENDKAKFEVAVPVTSGNRGNLCLGKRGIFCDINGREADARIVHIIENPISLAEALLLPFVKLGRMLTGKIESITSEAEKKFDKKASATMDLTSPTPAAATTKAPLGGPAGGMLLGAGIALAALGSALAYISDKIAKNPWTILVGVAIALLAVMLPISIVAYLKLRKRDLSAILEGSGWAINARMRLTRKQGRFFTMRPGYPKDSRGIPRVSKSIIVAIIVILTIVLGGGYFLKRHLAKTNTPPGPTPANSLPANEQSSSQTSQNP